MQFTLRKIHVDITSINEFGIHFVRLITRVFTTTSMHRIIPTTEVPIIFSKPRMIKKNAAERIIVCTKSGSISEF